MTICGIVNEFRKKIIERSGLTDDEVVVLKGMFRYKGIEDIISNIIIATLQVNEEMKNEE